MAYIAVDLKVIEGLASDVARATDTNEDRVGWGLVRLWHRTWSDKATLRTRAELAGIFGGGRLDELISALVEAGFLEPHGDSWRVRGASRYLRLKEALSRGGQKSRANLRRGNSPALKPEDSPALEPGASPALSPSTEHRAPSTESTTSAPRKKRASPAPAADPRLTPLTAQLCEVDYPIVRREAYRHGGAKDALALKALLPIASDEEIRARWRKGLCATGWASCSTLAQLGAKWNDLAAPAKASNGPVDAGTQVHVAGDVDWGPQ